METIWYLYILRCADDTLYTGITTDVPRRFAAHSCGKGAKYTRGRGPLALLYQERCGSHSQALKRELQVKALPREEKLALTIDKNRPEDYHSIEASQQEETET